MDYLIADSVFHNPILKIGDDKKQKVHDVVKDLILTRTKLVQIQRLFREELELGLELNPKRKSAFYMCNTFVTDIPDGSECGNFLSMDFGNSNIRVVLTQLNPGTKPKFHVKHYDIDIKLRRSTAEELFDYLADCINDFIKNSSVEDIGSKRLPMGFTFSFGYDQMALDKGIVTNFGIDTSLPDAIGKDVVQFLRDALKRKKLNVEVIAMLNDTTGTLVMGAYMDRDTAIGFILGSGSNICYYEQLNRIEKIDKTLLPSDATHVILNTEYGFLGDDGSTDFAKSQFDRDIDRESLFPENYSFEKLIGGNFIGELLRRVLLTITESGVLLNGKVTDVLKTKDSISASDISNIESNQTNDYALKLFNRLNYLETDISDDDIEIVRYVCSLISVRIALLSAAVLSVVIERIDRPIVKVAIDGSLYSKHPKLHRLITDFICEFIPNQKFELFLASDGSGKGAGLVAAIADKNKC